MVRLINSRLGIKLEARTFLNPLSSPLDIKGERIAATQSLPSSGIPRSHRSARSRPLRFHEGGCNTVIETIHPIISSTFTTRLDLHTLQRAFPTHHLTRLDHQSNGTLPF